MMAPAPKVFSIWLMALLSAFASADAGAGLTSVDPCRLATTLAPSWAPCFCTQEHYSIGVFFGQVKTSTVFLTGQRRPGKRGVNGSFRREGGRERDDLADPESSPDQFWKRLKDGSDRVRAAPPVLADSAQRHMGREPLVRAIAGLLQDVADAPSGGRRRGEPSGTARPAQMTRGRAGLGKAPTPSSMQLERGKRIADFGHGPANSIQVSSATSPRNARVR